MSFPFTDLSGTKVRPALIVGRPMGEDVILAFMTSRSLVADPQAEIALLVGDPEFPGTGLKGPAVIRLGKLVTLHRDLVRRRLGQIGPQTELAVGRALRYVLDL